MLSGCYRNVNFRVRIDTPQAIENSICKGLRARLTYGCLSFQAFAKAVQPTEFDPAVQCQGLFGGNLLLPARWEPMTFLSSKKMA